MSEKWLFAVNMLASKCWKSHVKSEEIQQIICVKLDEIGDMATSIGVFRALKTYAPQATLTVLCKPFVGSLIHTDPAVDKVVYDVKELPPKTDVWIELRGTWQTWWLSLWRTKKVRLDRGTIRFRHRGNQMHERSTNEQIMEPLVGKNINADYRIFYTQEQAAEAEAILHSKQLTDFVVFHPGGRSKWRHWPYERYAQLANYIWQQHQLKSLIIGTPDEMPIIQSIADASLEATKIWMTESSLGTFAAVLSRATLFVGNESGPLQIADAMEVPSVALFGPGVANVFYPKTKNSRLFHEVLECNPCDQIHCVQPDTSCMKRIPLISVCEAVSDVLESIKSS